MTTLVSTPVNRPSLAASAAIGACVGLAIGSAYVAGALARASVEDAQARTVAGSTVRGTLRGPAPAHDMAPAIMAQAAAPPSGPAPTLTRVDLRGPAAPSRDLECLSQAVYYEARGEAERGREAVAQVVMNRAHHPRFPKSICGVVFQHAASGCAFSFACDGATRAASLSARWRALSCRNCGRRPTSAAAATSRKGWSGSPRSARTCSTAGPGMRRTRSPRRRRSPLRRRGRTRLPPPPPRHRRRRW